MDNISQFPAPKPSPLIAQQNHPPMPAVQSKFWPNPDFSLKVSEREGFMGGRRLPLTALHGPHSEHIAQALSKHAVLKHFAGGVDERAVYSPNHCAWGHEHVDWDVELNNHPLAFGFYDEQCASHEVYCLHIEELEIDRDHCVYRICLSAIVYLGFERSDQGFIDLKEPILMKLDPFEDTLEVDITRLPTRLEYDTEDIIDRLKFVANVMSNVDTYLVPA